TGPWLFLRRLIGLPASGPVLPLNTFTAAGRARARAVAAGAAPAQVLAELRDPRQGLRQLTADDLLTEGLGNPKLATRISDLLVANGLARLDAEELSMWAADLSQVEGMQIRGSSPSRSSLAVRGTVTDRHITVLMEAFVVNVRATAAPPFELLKMNVA